MVRAAWLVLLVGCGTVSVDTMPVCVTVGADGTVLLSTTANGGELLESASCTLGRDGDAVVLSTEVRSRYDTTPFTTQDIGMIMPYSCELDAPLEDGSYTLTYGDETATFDVPGDSQVCFGREPLEVDLHDRACQLNGWETGPVEVPYGVWDDVRLCWEPFTEDRCSSEGWNPIAFDQDACTESTTLQEADGRCLRIACQVLGPFEDPSILDEDSPGTCGDVTAPVCL